ncbi:uncharacterized protein J8A68_004388 [[Candida] subhashii]|uniref:Uncharacterized protein n=1 Tax=[Candida] subhashii TaxID=561895 RepID=A0A8J5QJB1_9ASCO|nr:uncharacterized protein J8A68_004388 [[Candida] subhashii]KAG7662126.1 hypothetical protein J8A68_004388 [[Candida] subhashii]
MKLEDLPPELIQSIFDLLPTSTIKYLSRNGGWTIPYALQSGFNSISIIHNIIPFDIPNITNHHHLEKRGILPTFTTPLLPNKNRTAVFGSLYELISFLDQNSGFIPTEVAFDSLDDLIIFHDTHHDKLIKIPYLKVSLPRYLPFNDSTFDKIKLIQSYPYNICVQQFPMHGDYSVDGATIQFNSEIRHLEIPNLHLSDPKLVLQQLPNLQSLSLDDLLELSLDDIPTTLRHVSFTNSKLANKKNYQLQLPESVSSMEIRDTISPTPLKGGMKMIDYTNVDQLKFSKGVFSISSTMILPPNLKKLMFWDCSMKAFPIFGQANHFQNLGNLVISGECYHQFYYDFFNSEFPDSLIEIYVNNTTLKRPSDDLYNNFPDFFDNSKRFIIGKKCHLPRHLKKLSLKCPDAIIKPTLQLPDTLERLELFDFSEIPNFSNLKLPTNLKYLRLDKSRVDLDGVVFPVGLEVLIISNIQVSNVSNSNLLELENLRTLSIKTTDKNIEISYVNGTPLGQCDFRNMKSLRTLESRRINCGSELLMKLPPSVQTLSLEECGFMNISPDFSFPQSLCEFKYTLNGINLDILENLPDTLEVIDLTNCAVSGSGTFRNMPRLQYLDLSCGLYESMIEEMHLERFSRLEVLRMRNSQIRNINLTKFPRNLTELHLAIPNMSSLTGDFAQQFPYLKYLIMDSTDLRKVEMSGTHINFASRIQHVSFMSCNFTSLNFINWKNNIGRIDLRCNPELDTDDIVELCQSYTNKGYLGEGIFTNALDCRLKRFRAAGIVKG